jgi:hypothetical protein
LNEKYSSLIFENEFKAKFLISNVKTELALALIDFEYSTADSSKAPQNILFEKRIKDGM